MLQLRGIIGIIAGWRGALLRLPVFA